MKPRPAHLVVALVLAWASHTASLLAQSTGRRGAVVDTAGAPVPGALVEVRSVALVRPRQVASAAEGRFRFPLLPPGPYSVLARLTGFQDAVLDEVRVPLGETITVRMELKVETAASVTVAEPVVPILDVTSARLGVSANRAVLANLPLGRNFASVALIAPGVGSDPAGPTVYGASSLENAFATDGLNSTAVSRGGQGRLLPLEFVSEVEVRTGGYDAEYGRSIGGNINVVTKSGGNDFHGTAFGYYDSDALASSDEHFSDRAAISTEGLEPPLRYDFGLNAGGPIEQDRLWFFGAWRTTERALFRSLAR